MEPFFTGRKELTMLFLFAGILSFAQENTATPPNCNGRTKLDDLIPATFSERNQAFAILLNSRFNTGNIDCSTSGVQRTVIEFVVEKDGSITNVKTEGRNESLNKEAVKTVKSIKQKWNAATLNGEKVRSKYKQPFTLVCQ